MVRHENLRERGKKPSCARPFHVGSSLDNRHGYVASGGSALPVLLSVAMARTAAVGGLPSETITESGRRFLA
jgi:hypothetical protein